MSRIEIAAVAPVSPPRAARSLPRIYWLEAKYEFLKTWRIPAFTLPSLGFPVVFYILFGLGMDFGPAGSVSMATYLLATYGCFGVIGASLFGFGVGVATERGQGWMLTKRVSPMPIGAYFAAKVALCMLYGGIIVASLATLGVAFGGVSLSVGTMVALIAILVAGALPFCALGLLIGTVAGPNSAPAIVNLIYLPMAFASGLWIPLPVLPRLFQTLAHALPPYHYSQLALSTFGADMGRPVVYHVIFLVLFTAAALGLAALAYRRDQGKTYG